MFNMEYFTMMYFNILQAEQSHFPNYPFVHPHFHNSNIYNTKFLQPPKLVLNKPVQIIAFRIALTHDVKIAWSGQQMAVSFKKRRKNEIFGCGDFQKFQCWCLLHLLQFYLTKAETIFKLVYPFWTQPSILLQGFKYSPSSFWP